jgi:hypothetical protein
MANIITGRQLIITVAGEIDINCNVMISDGVWTGAAAGATLTITDKSGRVLTWTAYQANYPVDLGKIGWLSGPITITTITSGTVFLFLGKS